MKQMYPRLTLHFKINAMAVLFKLCPYIWAIFYFVSYYTFYVLRCVLI